MPLTKDPDWLGRGKIEGLQTALHAAESQVEQQAASHASLQEEVTRTRSDLKEIETLFREAERVRTCM